jgi:hypothetical protein
MAGYGCVCRDWLYRVVNPSRSAVLSSVSEFSPHKTWPSLVCVKLFMELAAGYKKQMEWQRLHRANCKVSRLGTQFRTTRPKDPNLVNKVSFDRLKDLANAI